MDMDDGAISWNDHLYFFTLYRALNGPDASPGKDSDNIIDVESHDNYYTEADLSAWIRDQSQSRKKFLDGKLSSITANQIKVLDSVSFPWILDSSERWDSHFRELVAFKQKHGHCDASTKVGKLGIWVKNQRAAYRKLCDAGAGEAGGASPGQTKITAVITFDQVKLLSDLGFQWRRRENSDQAFHRHVEKLREFAKKNGHVRVTQKDDKELWQWILYQRKEHSRMLRGKYSKTRDERNAILESVEGFTWKGISRKTEEKKAEEKRRKKEQREKAKAKKKEERERKKFEEAEEKKRLKEEKKRKRLEEANEKKSKAVKKREDNKRHKFEDDEEKFRRKEETARKKAEKKRMDLEDKQLYILKNSGVGKRQPQRNLVLPASNKLMSAAIAPPMAAGLKLNTEAMASARDAAIHRSIELNLAAQTLNARIMPAGPAVDAETTARARAAAVSTSAAGKPAAEKAPPMPTNHAVDKDAIARARSKAG